jgi:hypothetical protein
MPTLLLRFAIVLENPLLNLTMRSAENAVTGPFFTNGCRMGNAIPSI